MASKHNTSELGLLRSVLSPENGKRYLERTEILNRANPEAWEKIDFPLEIALELTNHCNLRCVMCPNPTLKRNKGYMEEGTFKKIIEDISKERGFLFMPQGFGEPLLHRKFSEFTKMASHWGIKPIVVLSNGMLLNEATLLSMLDSVDILIVTIDGVKAETYESIRVGGNLEKVTRNVDQFLKMRGDRKRPYLVLRIIDMKGTEQEIPKFKECWWNKIRETDIIQVAGYNDWAGSIHSETTRVKGKEQRHPCRMLWKNLTVFHNGQVTPCCYDAEGELSIGNVVNQSIQELWNGTALTEIRDIHLAHRFEQIPICQRCNSWF